MCGRGPPEIGTHRSPLPSAAIGRAIPGWRWRAVSGLAAGRGSRHDCRVPHPGRSAARGPHADARSRRPFGEASSSMSAVTGISVPTHTRSSLERCEWAAGSHVCQLLALLGVFVLENRHLHVHVGPTSSRLRFARKPETRFGTARRRVRVHWTNLIEVPGSSCSVQVLDALAHAVVCQTPRTAVATHRQRPASGPRRRGSARRAVRRVAGALPCPSAVGRRPRGVRARVPRADHGAHARLRHPTSSRVRRHRPRRSRARRLAGRGVRQQAVPRIAGRPSSATGTGDLALAARWLLHDLG